MEKIKVELFNNEVEVLDQVVSVVDIIKAKEDTIKTALTFAEGLENEWDACVSTTYPEKEFHSICIHPVNLYENAEEMDSEDEDGYFAELREQYCINLSLFELLDVSEAELIRKLQRMDKIYSNSILGMWDKDLCSDVKWNDKKEQYSFMMQDILIRFNEDGQRIADYICDSRGVPDVKTKQEYEPYEYKLAPGSKCKCQWKFGDYLV